MPKLRGNRAYRNKFVKIKASYRKGLETKRPDCSLEFVKSDVPNLSSLVNKLSEQLQRDRTEQKCQKKLIFPTHTERDVSAFSASDFEVKEWINSAFRSAEAKENTDAFVSSLVMRLQLFVQQVNSALEDTSDQVLQILPRIIVDADALQLEAMALHKKMLTVKEEATKVQQETGQLMATLEHIDSIKTRLQAAKQALHEADNWSLLATDLEDVFESGDVEQIANLLNKMQHSLMALTSVPDFDDRQRQLEGLKNRLEALATPLLVQAFTSGSTDQSRIYVRIFSDMGRLPQLIKYYHKCQEKLILQQWRNLVEIQQDEPAPSLLNAGYDMLLSSWHAQVKWCGHVFSTVSTATVLVELFADTIILLEPSLNTCIDRALKEHEEPLSLLLELRQSTEQFCSNFQAAIDAVSHGKTAVASEKVQALARSIYLPWMSYVDNYASMEKQHLLKRHKSLLEVHEELSDTVQSLGQSVVRVVAAASEAHVRCQQLTYNTAFCGLLTALKSLFDEHLKHFYSALKCLEKQKGDGEDWNIFQMCLTLLQSVGQLLSELQHLDGNMSKALRKSGVIFTEQGTANPFTNYNELLLNETGREELRKLIASLKDGGSKGVLEKVISDVEKLCGAVHETTFKVIFAPIVTQLDLVKSAPAWCGDARKSGLAPSPDLPDYSFAPQEYITQIGQYLMTLPQHLEPFLLRDNPALTLALNVAVSNAGNGGADLLLAGVARSTCQTYCDQILGISTLSPSASKQLATDIDYLGNVLEDLGLVLSEHLTQLSTLLRLPVEEYQNQSSGCNPRLVAAVRQMRDITFLE